CVSVVARAVHSFPTRRSSDLGRALGDGLLRQDAGRAASLHLKEAEMGTTHEERRQILRGLHAHLRGTIEAARRAARNALAAIGRSEEHTSELQSRGHLVCRLL